MRKITVMSAGNGGQALAGDLALRGHDVVLFEHPSFEATIDAIQAAGNAIRLENKVSGTGYLRKSTTDPAEALEDAEIIYFTAPSFAQDPFFELSLPFFKDGQVLILSPGNYGTFALRNAFEKAGKRVVVGETDNLPYACTATEPGRVNIRGVKNPVTLAVLPAGEYDEADRVMRDAFCTGYKKGESVLQTSMANTNMIVHCVPMIMNAARIEDTKGNFRFYFDGMTPAVCDAMEAVDKERLAVSRAFGLELMSTTETIRTQYHVQGDDLYSVIQSNPAFGGDKPDAPKTLKHRFITEDAPFSMLPIIELGKLAGVTTPVMRAVVELCGLLTGEDYFQTGMTLSKMGFEGKSVSEIQRILRG